MSALCEDSPQSLPIPLRLKVIYREPKFPPHNILLFLGETVQEGMLGVEGPLAGVTQSPPQLGTKRGFLGPLGAEERVEGRGVLGLDKGCDASSSWHPRPAPHTSCRVSRRGPLCPVCPPVRKQAILSGKDGWETERWAVMGGLPVRN